VTHRDSDDRGDTPDSETDRVAASPRHATNDGALARDATHDGAAPPDLDVLVVGAGLSGVGAGHYLQTHCPWASYAIFEARGAIGGTWDLFRYPGIRSDSDMHTLGYSFRPWDGEKSIADGASILRYIEDTASESGVDAHIRFHHRVTAAEWSSADARWHVTVERSDTGETLHLTAGFVFACSGYYRYDHGYQPDFAGMEDFAGPIVHPQAWPEDLDVSGRRVVVIGSGATAVTLVPALARAGAQVTMLQRSPSYIASLPERSPVAALARRVLPAKQAGTVAKWFHAVLTQAFYQLSRRYPTFVKRMLRAGLRRELPPGYDIETHFTPRYDPWDQRFCAVPDGDLFEAIRAGTVTVVTDHIERFSRSGLVLTSGTELAADVVVTATGLELLFLGGMALSVDGEHVDPATRLTYKGMMLEGVPNLAIAVGYVNASWTLKCDLTCDYVCRLLNHMRARGLRSCVPRNLDGAAAEDGPLLGLSSGYITRSAHLLPRQGTRQPWRVHQSYLRDWRALKRAPLEDQAMQFSGTRRQTPAWSDGDSRPGAGAGVGAEPAVPVASP
jgi:monooxygenase